MQRLGPMAEWGSSRVPVLRIGFTLALLIHAVWLQGCVTYRPAPLDSAPFLERAQTHSEGGVQVTVSALGRSEGRRYFGVPLDRNGIQPVWLRIENAEDAHYLFFQQSVDPSYYAPLEAAYKSHFSPGKRFLAYGVFGLLLWPLLFVAPLQYFSARHANGKMDELFVERGIGNRLVEPGGDASGFVYAQLDEGTKKVNVRLLSPGAEKQFRFFVQVPGLRVDHHHVELSELYADEEVLDVNGRALLQEIEALPCCTANAKETRMGDPLNLVIVATFEDLLRVFTRTGWDETEVIDVGTSFKTAVSFLFGSAYRYSPVSNLYLFGRSQDLAFQKARETIHERNHLRLWLAPYVYRGKPVWVGQVSRDIGVRFTTKTWNLTTHKIDPDVDDARENVLGDLIGTQHVLHMGYVRGVGPRDRDTPGRNLTGDPYFTDGMRAAVEIVSEPTELNYFNWKGDALTRHDAGAARSDAAGAGASAARQPRGRSGCGGRSAPGASHMARGGES